MTKEVIVNEKRRDLCMRIAKACILEKVVQVGLKFVGMMWVKIFPAALTLPETLPVM